MTKTIGKINTTSDKGLLVMSGLGVAVNALLALLITFGLPSTSESSNLISTFSVVIMVIGAVTLVLSIVALVKVRSALKLVAILNIMLTAGIVLLAYFNIWWLGY